jgi:thioredoxin reductase (NADPH)
MTHEPDGRIEKGESMVYESIIVGGGPAGLSAGLYMAKAGMNVILFEGTTLGGQILSTDRVDNTLGFGDIEAWQLADRMIEHAKSSGLKIETEKVEEAGVDGKNKYVRLASGKRVEAQTLVLACGGSPRKLGIPGEKELSLGKGVSYCAVCDGGFFKGKDVVVVGGGDAAATEANHLAHLANHVHIVHRRDEWRAKPQLVKRMLDLENVTAVLDSVPAAVLGEESVTGVRVKNVKSDEESVIDAQGFFVAIGFIPNSQIFSGAIEKDEEGFITTDSRMRTSVPGVFAVGDLRSNVGRQIAISVGDGAAAALSVSHYLGEGE